MNWLFIYEDKNNKKTWSTPKGFGEALGELNINLLEYTFQDSKKARSHALVRPFFRRIQIKSFKQDYTTKFMEDFIMESGLQLFW